MRARLSQTLSDLADLAEIGGRTREMLSLRAAASTLDTLGQQAKDRVEHLLRSGQLPTFPHIEPAAAQKLREMAMGGAADVIREATAAIPRDLRRLLAIPGINIEDVALLHRHLGITTLGELSFAAESGLLDTVPGLESPRESRIRQALDNRGSENARIPLGRAYAIAEPILAALGSFGGGIEEVTAVGSLRRFEPTVGDIELLVVAAEPEPVLDTVAKLPGALSLLHRGGAKANVEFEQSEVTVRVIPPKAHGASLVHFTGSVPHNTELRRLAAIRGVQLTPLELRQSDGGTPSARLSESEVYERLGLPFIPPELRQGAGEIEAALTGRLPRLVERHDILGDLHMHSVWSDGRDSIETMVQACQKLGYRYMAITDHSRSSDFARGLDVDRLMRQRDEIEELRRRVPDIAILHGSEVDILPDGSLDFPDAVLEQLDLVLASLHDPAGQRGDRLTARYLAAIRHPLVSIITHPTNRVVGQRGGYDLDFDAIFDAALETGTALEIDGAPVHLDMDGAVARRAVAAGVMVSISSDCHRAELLDRQMRFGVATARRGWVEAVRVLNARPLPEVRAIIARKRVGG